MGKLKDYQIILSFSLLLTFCLFLLIECNFSNPQPTPVKLAGSKGYPQMFLAVDNPPTEEGIKLGRMLYYDPIIDSGNQRSCGQCHIQKSAFACPDNCLPHINLTWNNAFLWNGKVRGTLENIMEFEVKKFFQTDLHGVNSDEKYLSLYKLAYGVDTITTKHIAYALAQFVRTLNSTNSKYDQWLRHEIKLTKQEIRGYEIFFSEKGDCFHCHGTILLTDNYFHNNGLDSIPDAGLAEVTAKAKDFGKFKTPTLKNIEYTAPYMHDGRYATLEEVIDFYSESLNWSPTVDPLMKKVHKGGTHLKAEEKMDLLAFLKTFSDTAFINNPDFSDPFLDQH